MRKYVFNRIEGGVIPLSTELKNKVLTSKEVTLVLAHVRRALQIQSSGITFDPMSNAYQSPDGTEVWIRLDPSHTSQLAIEFENGNASGIFLEKFSGTSSNSTREIIDLVSDVKLEIFQQDGHIWNRTSLLSNDINTLNRFFSTGITVQSPVYLDDPGLINPNRNDPCTDEYAAVLAASKDLSNAWRGSQNAALAWGAEAAIGAAAGFATGGPITAAVGYVAGNVLGGINAIGPYQELQEARRDFQFAALLL
ncbi:MAG: hypothetical protein ACK41E_03255 [Deinococcales bacterium]